MRKRSRLGVAIGGFLLISGMVLAGTVLLASLNLIDIGILTNERHMLLLMFTFILIGTLDLAAGIILFWR